MAFVSGLGGGHMNATYIEKGENIQSKQYIENCGCIPFTISRGESKKSARMRLWKERMRQFSIWFFEMEDQREIEHARRRLERKKRKRMMSQGAKNCCLHYLYIFDFILWIVGIVFTLCSSMKTFGKNTEFYRRKDLYRVLGPGILAVAMLILLLATGLKHRLRRKHTRTHRNFFIVKKKGSKQCIEKKDSDNDSGNEEDIEMTEIKRDKIRDREAEIDEENMAIAKNIIKSDKKWSDGYTLECTKLVTETDRDKSYHKKRMKDRRAWAKTKWMRVDTESDEEDGLGEVIDFEHASQSLTRDDIDGSTDTDRTPRVHEKRRLTRFRPIPGGCLSTQSSIRSQASELSFASTTSESAPLVRK